MTERVQYRDWMRERDQLPPGVVVMYWRAHPTTGIAGDYPTITTPCGPRVVADGEWILSEPKA